MRWITAWGLVLAVTLSASVAGADEKAVTFRFGRAELNSLPVGWKADRTGEGKGSEWKVVADKTAPSRSGYVLAQLAQGRSQLFNLCVAEKTKYQNLEMSVRLKAVSGKIDQGGGVVWRYQDAENYYVCRYNPLEDNFRVYKVVKGKRIQLATKEEVTFKEGAWITLSIIQKGEEITCSLDGKKLLEVKDDAFKGTGKIGLWSKADAVTHFDGLTVTGR